MSDIYYELLFDNKAEKVNREILYCILMILTTSYFCY
jgi:hypothetical protein